MRTELTTLRISSPIFYRWLCFFIAACLLIPPFYPASLGGQVPLYAGNFIFVAGGLVFLQKSNLISISSDRVLRFGFYFLGALGLSLPFAWWFSGPGLTSHSLLRYALLCQPFLLYWLIRSSTIFADETRLKSFVKLLVWIGAVVGVYGIIDFYWPIPFPHPFANQFIYLRGQSLRRAQGVFYESSSFGNLCAFFLSLTSCLTLSLRSFLPKRQQLTLFVFSGIFVTALFLSYSRGSWMAFFVTLAIFLALQPRIRFRDVVITALVGSIPILILYLFSPEIVSNFFSYRVGSLGKLSQNPNFATSGRWGSWSALILFFAAHPWLLFFGIGYKTLPYTTLFGKSIIADNGYLSVLFECGIVGLVTLLWMNLSLLRSFQQVRHAQSPFRSFVGTFMLAFWCGEMVQLSTGDIFTYWRNLVLFFALAAAIITDREMTKTSIHILFVDQFGTLGGGQKVLSMLIQSMDKKRFKCVAALNGHGEFRTQLSQSGIEVTTLPLGDYPSQEKSILEQVRFLLKTLLSTIYLIYYIKKKEIDIIYANGPRTFFCTTLAGLVTRLPVLWHLHSVLPAGIPRRLTGHFSHWTSKIIACSRATALPLLQGNSSLAVKLEIVPNPRPVDAETVNREEALQILGLSQLETKRVGFGMMGRITPFKGQLHFLKAAALVARNRKDAYFWIFGSPAPGDDHDLRYLQQLIRFRVDCALESSIIFVPRRDDIEICYSLFDILVLASQGEEGLPLCALEGLSLGKPVISPGTGGLSDILENGFNSLLVDEVSPEALAEKMLELLDSSQKRQQFSVNARSRMESWITPQVFSQRLERILTDSIRQ